MKEARRILRVEVRLVKPKAIRAYTEETVPSAQIEDLAGKQFQIGGGRTSLNDGVLLLRFMAVALPGRKEPVLLVLDKQWRFPSCAKQDVFGEVA